MSNTFNNTIIVSIFAFTILIDQLTNDVLITHKSYWHILNSRFLQGPDLDYNRYNKYMYILYNIIVYIYIYTGSIRVR